MGATNCCNKCLPSGEDEEEPEFSPVATTADSVVINHVQRQHSDDVADAQTPSSFLGDGSKQKSSTSMMASQVTTGTSCTMTVPVPMSYPKHLLQRPLSEDTYEFNNEMVEIPRFEAEIDEDTEPETTTEEDSYEEEEDEEDDDDEEYEEHEVRHET